MSTLKRLEDKGRVLVDEGFLSSTTVVLNVDEVHVQKAGRSVNLQEFHEVVADAIKTYTPFNTDVDAYIASRLHQALPLSPREAGDIGVWHYLSVIESPDFVRHRWRPKKNGMVSKERFLGSFVRNTFARLWWGAELTVKAGEDYSLTEALFSKTQDLYEAVIGRAFSRYPPATHAFLNVLGAESEDMFRLVAKNLTHVLTTVVLEDMDEVEIEALLREMIKAV